MHPQVPFASVVQWIEWQIPVLLIWVRFPSGVLLNGSKHCFCPFFSSLRSLSLSVLLVWLLTLHSAPSVFHLLVAVSNLIRFNDANRFDHPHAAVLKRRCPSSPVIGFRYAGVDPEPMAEITTAGFVGMVFVRNGLSSCTTLTKIAITCS